MTIFSPDGKYELCLLVVPTSETVVIAVADHTIVGRVPQASPFCPDIAATPDSTQVCSSTLKDTGKTAGVFNAQPPFNVLLRIDRHRSGSLNHVNIVRVTRNGQFKPKGVTRSVASTK